jgi:Nif-specific regulatory protein
MSTLDKGKAEEHVQSVLEQYPAKTEKDRKKHIQVVEPGEEKCSVVSNRKSRPGVITMRGCAYAGAKGVVWGPIKDVVHVSHGPVGCGQYSWGSRRNYYNGTTGVDSFGNMQFTSDFQEEKSRLEAEVSSKYTYNGLAGNSKVMREVYNKINMVSKSKTTVLIRGESGTGKEVVAKTIHYNGERANKPFIAINCAAIPKELIESELFGHEKGAFTGANNEKKGKFEVADGGTIFLDEIGDMPYEAQSKLLRVLQDMQVQKIGSNKSKSVDVRVIAATNKNLETEVKDGNFRLDLYYRLNVVSILIPPLRMRKKDIPSIAMHILNNLNKTYGTDKKLSTGTLDVLRKCNWPGNVRELENCIERSMLVSTEDIIDSKCLSCKRGDLCYAHTFNDAESSNDMENSQMHYQHLSVGDEEADEKQRLIEALKKNGWVQARTARELGMTVRQINYRIEKFGIKIKKL